MKPGPGAQRTPLPRGFRASGVNCGVRRYRPDLGIIISDRPATTVGVFTQNKCQAAPILYCKSLLPSNEIIAIITNSGQANAATGPAGIEANREMAFGVAKELVCLPRQVLTASTGVIGQMLEIKKISEGLPTLISRATDTAESFALAILTTDLVPKTVTTNVKLSGGEIQITGICKGSGMIHPQMATMLGYVVTDAALAIEEAQKFLHDAVDVSFNMISVDGDMSTNDCCFLMANGASQVALTTPEDKQLFSKALIEVCQFLAQMIARDGEGASKLVEVQLIGAPNLHLARRVARGVTLSPLVKTAIHGEDPNWGRILARLGAEQVPSEILEQMKLSIQGFDLYDQGKPLNFDRAQVRSALRSEKIEILVDLRAGTYQAKAWGCDLSRKYVDINTEYPT